MVFFRKKSPPRDGGSANRDHFHCRPSLFSASLGSPIFVERWNGGSPLNWVEFTGRWEHARSERNVRSKEN